MKKVRGKEPPATNRFSKFLGSGFVDPANEVVLKFGRNSWTRLQMSDKLRCVSYTASRDFVTPVLEELGITKVEQIAGMDPKRFWKHKVPGKPSRGLGISSMNVLMSLIKHVLHRNPYHWVAGESEDLVTLATWKNREKTKSQKRKKRRKK